MGPVRRWTLKVMVSRFRVPPLSGVRVTVRVGVRVRVSLYLILIQANSYDAFRSSASRPSSGMFRINITTSDRYFMSSYGSPKTIQQKT